MDELTDRVAEAIWDELDSQPGSARLRTINIGALGRAALTAIAVAGYAVVKLPERSAMWRIVISGEIEDVYVRDGNIVISGVDDMTPEHARRFAGVLLAAAQAAEQIGAPS